MMKVDHTLKALVASEEARQVTKFQEKLAERERKRQLKRTSSASSHGSVVSIDPLQEPDLFRSPFASLLKSCRESKLISEHSSSAPELAEQLSTLLETFGPQQDKAESVKLLCQKVGLDASNAENVNAIQQALFDENGNINMATVSSFCDRPHSALPTPVADAGKSHLSNVGRSSSGSKLAPLSVDSHAASEGESAGSRSGNRRFKQKAGTGAEPGLNGITNKKLDLPPTWPRQAEQGGQVSREQSVEEAIFRNLSIETEGPLLSAENSLVLGDGNTPATENYALDFSRYSSATNSPSLHAAREGEHHFAAQSPPALRITGQQQLAEGSPGVDHQRPHSLLSPRAAARDLLNVDLETWLVMGSVEQITSSKRRSPLRFGQGSPSGKVGSVLASKYRQGNHAVRASTGNKDQWLGDAGKLEIGSAGAAMRKSLDQMQMQREGGKALYSPPNPLKPSSAGLEELGRRMAGGYSRELRRAVARAAGEEAQAVAERLSLENSLLVMHFDDKMKQASEERSKLLHQLEESVALCSFLRSQLQEGTANAARQSEAAASPQVEDASLREVLDGVRRELQKLGEEREGLKAENQQLLAANRQLEEERRSLRTEKEAAEAEAEARGEELRALKDKKAARKAERHKDPRDRDRDRSDRGSNAGHDSLGSMDHA